MHNLLQAVERLNKKFVGPGLQNYMCWLRACWLWIDGGTNLQLHENAVNAEMDQEKKPQGQDNGQAPFNSLADVLTDSNECLTRVVDLIYKSVVSYVDTARMLITFSLQ